MKKLKRINLRTIVLLTIVTLFLSLPSGMDAKKRSNRSSTKTTNVKSQKTIYLCGSTVEFYLYPSGAVRAEALFKGTYDGTWTQHSRIIGNGNKQIYYEINVGGHSFYWAKGGDHVFTDYSSFIKTNYSNSEAVSWSYQ